MNWKKFKLIRIFIVKNIKIILCLVPPRITESIDPCTPSPCGENALCNTRNRAAACTCIPGYFGDPYVACRPECTISSECPATEACRNYKCTDPCPGLCGTNAVCRVVNHIATCSCNQGFVGDPFVSCQFIPPSKYWIVKQFYTEFKMTYIVF